MKWQTSAPSNLALIKYMGKIDTSINAPTNASLSYTLNKLLTFVEIETCEENHDHWEPLALKKQSDVIELSERGIKRFLKHAHYLKEIFNYPGHFIIRSNNNFPSDCGLASSASSYAALTKAMIMALTELTDTPEPSIAEQAMLSRHASGSSCRSFFSPWCLWKENTVTPIKLPYDNLIHQVIIVDKNKKTPSTSEAHKIVPSSLLFEDRPQRAEKRLGLLRTALENQHWESAYRLCWQEFWDMHALFETASPHFGYMTKATVAVLTFLRKLWQQHNDGPIVTMDAGANIHLLFRAEQPAMAEDIKQHLSQHYLFIEG